MESFCSSIIEGHEARGLYNARSQISAAKRKINEIRERKFSQSNRRRRGREKENGNMLLLLIPPKQFKLFLHFFTFAENN